MRLALVAVIALVVSLPHASNAFTWTSAASWSAQTSPKAGPAQAIGAYHAGCVQGAIALPPEGPGFELLHLGRRRHFGHPTLVDYVRRLATAAARKRLPALLVGDLSQPRGGPTPTDHGSHQSGLDVDVAYTRPAESLRQPLDATRRESFEFVPVVDPQHGALMPAWRPHVVGLLELAAADPAVDRIFVNPGVKRELCQSRAGAAWLARLRPWWGHHDHFHVRLKCPPESRECRAQAPVPPGDGCGAALAWWFSEEARIAAAKRRQPEPPGVAKARTLPAQCRQVLR